MESISPHTDLQDMDVYVMSNAMDPNFATAWHQDMEPCQVSNSMERTLPPADFQNIGLALMSNGMEPTWTAPDSEVFAFSIIRNAMDVTFTGAGPGNMESSLVPNAMSPTLTASARPQTGSGIFTMSSALESTSTPAGVQDSVLPGISSKAPAANGKWASKDDWTRAQPMIKRLRVDERRKLKDIMAIMEKEHGFKATPKMYKDRIRDWNFSKNFKEPEMAVILRKKTQRDGIGKKSTFQIRGRGVTIEEVHRYFQRKQTALDVLSTKYAQATTPPYISCLTPPLSPGFEFEVPRSPSTPGSLLVPERLFGNINRYMTTCFDNKTWILDDDGACTNTFTSSRCLGDISDFYTYCSMSTVLFRMQSFFQARRSLSKGYGLIPSILKGEDPRTIECLLEVFFDFIAKGLPEITAQLLGYISKMARILLDSEHPWGQVCRLLGSIEPENVTETLVKFSECMTNIFVQNLGPFQEVSLSSQVSFIESSCIIEGSFVACQRLRNLSSQCKEASHSFSRGFCQLPSALGVKLYDQEKCAEAEEVAFELLKISREIENFAWEVTALESAARAQYRQGKLDLVEINIREALQLLSTKWDDSDPSVLGRMVSMKLILQGLGLEQLAAELEMQIERRLVLCKLDHDDI